MANDFNSFVKQTFGGRNSVFTCITGPNGTGKTAMNLLLLERIHDLGLGARFGSNMPVPEAIRPHFDMDFIEDFETLEEICKILNPPKTRKIKKYFFFLSELGKFVPKDEAWKKDNRKFIQKLQTVRKYGLNMLSDGIDRIDSRVLSPMFFNGELKKPYPDNPRYGVYLDYRNRAKTFFEDIPKCKMWFDTYYSANFYIDKQGDAESIKLDQTEEIVKQYRETGSWKKAGVTTQQGKRELFKVIDRYFSIRQPIDPKTVSKESEAEASSTD